MLKDTIYIAKYYGFNTKLKINFSNKVLVLSKDNYIFEPIWKPNSTVCWDNNYSGLLRARKLPSSLLNTLYLCFTTRAITL